MQIDFESAFAEVPADKRPGLESRVGSHEVA